MVIRVTNPFGKKKVVQRKVKTVVQPESDLVDVKTTPVVQRFAFNCSDDIMDLIIQATSEGGYKGYHDYLVTLVRRDPLVHSIMARKAQ